MKKAKIVNLMGLSHGVGTTHFAIMLGTFLTQGCHCRVALIEYGQHGSYEKIKQEEKTNKVRLSLVAAKKYAFSCHGMDFYQSVSNGGLVGMLSSVYDYIIVEMAAGEEFRQSTKLLGELLNGEICIAVISDTPWKAKECRERLVRLQEFANGKEVKVVSMTRNKNHIPWEPNPFCIRAENLPWFQTMVE